MPPALVQRTSSPAAGSAIGVTTWKAKWLPNPSISGNCIVVIANAGASGTAISVSDDKSNTYTSTTAIDDATNNARLQIFYALNVAAATQKITVTFTGGPSFNQIQAYEFSGVATASALDGQAGQTTSGTSLTTGSFTTATSGDLIISAAVLDSFSAQTAPVSWTAGSNFTLASPDGGSFLASQFQVQSAAGAINPTITSSLSAGAITKAIALKAGASGGDLAAGIKVRGINTQNFEQIAYMALTGTSFSTQTYVSGNMLAIGWTGRTAVHPTGLSSSPSLTWNVQTIQDDPSTQNALVWYWAANATPGTLYTITQTFGSTPSSYMMNYFDISGAATSPFDTVANASGTSAASSGVINGPSITPSTANGLVLAVQQQSGETITAVSPGYFVAPDVGGYSSDGVETDQGLGMYYNPNTSAVQIAWTYSNYESGTAIGPWVSQAIALKAPAAATTAAYGQMPVFWQG